MVTDVFYDNFLLVYDGCVLKETMILRTRTKRRSKVFFVQLWTGYTTLSEVSIKRIPNRKEPCHLLFLSLSTSEKDG